MGPIIIFDKSALQSFSIDESVWLDNFFLANITPLFYVETLADLSLKNSKRPPEQIISELAIKTPKALPNIHHSHLILGSLLGRKVEIKHGRPIVARGTTKESPEGKIGVNFEETAEEKALKRWNEKDFTTIEKDFAKKWRERIETLNFDLAIQIVQNILPSEAKLKSLEGVKKIVSNLVNKSDKQILLLLFDFLDIPDKYRTKTIQRWQNEKEPQMNKFAPYASYVFEIDLLFYISASKGIISKERPSNKVDMAYLYYLPFCQTFISGDKLHKKVVPLFLKDNQTFMSAKKLKTGLSDLNRYYKKHKDVISEKGVIQFATYPPIELDTSVSQLWDQHCPNWRKNSQNKKRLKKDGDDKKLIKHLKKVEKESKVVNPSVLKDMDEANHVIVKHSMAVQKGSWRILPKGIENKKDKEDS